MLTYIFFNHTPHLVNITIAEMKCLSKKHSFINAGLICKFFVLVRIYCPQLERKSISFKTNTAPTY